METPIIGIDIILELLKGSILKRCSLDKGDQIIYLKYGYIEDAINDTVDLNCVLLYNRLEYNHYTIIGKKEHSKYDKDFIIPIIERLLSGGKLKKDDIWLSFDSVRLQFVLTFAEPPFVPVSANILDYIRPLRNEEYLEWK